MSEAMLGKDYLRDDLHPKKEFTAVLLDMYLNLHAEYGQPISSSVAPPGLPADFTIEELLENRADEWRNNYQEEKMRLAFSGVLNTLYKNCPEHWIGIVFSTQNKEK